MIEHSVLAIHQGEIAWVGAQSDLPGAPDELADGVQQLGGALLAPGLIDSHTHMMFGGQRVSELGQRLHEVSYENIARAGGGIATTVQATGAASEDDLLAQSLPRARQLMADGVTTLEIKSGYVSSWLSNGACCG